MQTPPSPPAPYGAAAAPPAAARRDPQVLVQLGAWRTRLKAEETLRAGRAAAPDPAAPPPLRVVAATVRGQAWWRVVAGPMPVGTAQALCARLAPAPCWRRDLDGAGRGSP